MSIHPGATRNARLVRPRLRHVGRSLAALASCSAVEALALSGRVPWRVPTPVVASVSYALNAAVFYVLGRRRSAPSAIERLRRDKRSPVVYLRSFRDTAGGSRRGFSPSWGTPSRLSSDGRRRAAAGGDSRSGRARHRDRTARRGASRGGARRGCTSPTATGGTWSSTCSPSAHGDPPVGDSAGIRWETERVGELMNAERVILFVPIDARARPSGGRRQVLPPDTGYDRRLPPTELPKSIGDASLIYFTSLPTRPDDRGGRAGPPARGGRCRPATSSSASNGSPVPKAFRRPLNIRGLTVVLLTLLAAIVGVFITVMIIAIFKHPGPIGMPAYIVFAILGSIETALIWIILGAMAGRLD